MPSSAFLPTPALPLRGARPLLARSAHPRRTVQHFTPARTVRMQTWSDPAVTQEYFDFLAGKVREELPDCQSTIVGTGRVGSLLAEHGLGDLIIKRGEQIPPDAPGPIYVCTRNDDLAEIVDNCPAEKKEDLVFMQNGFMEKFMREHGVDDNTQASIYFAIDKLGKKPIDGITEKSPDGLTTVCGKWEVAFAERMERAGLSCRVVKERDFRRNQLEKLIWISCINLIGAVHGNIPMGEVAKMHVKEVTEMSIELAQMVRFTLTVGMLPDIEERILAYTRVVKDFPTGLKEFEWRNGFFYGYSKLALKKGFPDPTPMHSSYLIEGKEMGILDW